MPDGLDAMQQARSRGKPQPRHPRKRDDQEQQQRKEESVATVTTEAEPATGEAGQQEPTTSAPVKQAPKASDKRAGSKSTRASRVTVAPAQRVNAGMVEGKQVQDMAKAWSATARRLGEREAILVASIEAARAAGTPSHVLLSALSGAEYSAGVAVPDEVWKTAGLERR